MNQYYFSLKNLIRFLLLTSSLLLSNAPILNAKPARDFAASATLKPDVCRIVFLDTDLECDYVAIGAFSDGNGNIKLCSDPYCLILILRSTQLNNVAKGKKFMVYSMAWQTGNSIDSQWQTDVTCDFDSDGGVGCIGKMEDNSSFATYFY
jgi:hypothetical protein